ncbi:MAG: hypothetical protein ACREHF_10845 [Rhizomicrobium sp.]
MDEKLSRAEGYRVRAEEVRVTADSMKNAETRRILRGVADEYEYMAAQIERMDLDNAPRLQRRKARR